MDLEGNDNIHQPYMHSQIDLTQPDDEYDHIQESLEHIMNDPERFQQKLLENGIVDQMFIDFLNEIDESGKTDQGAINQAQVFIDGEIERVKQSCENRIQQLKLENQITLKEYDSTIVDLQNRIQELEAQNQELMDANFSKSGSANRTNIRRNSENTRVVNTKFNRERSSNRFEILNKPGHNKDPQYLEDENFKLKKQLEEHNDKYEKASKKWENKFNTQKKTIDDLKIESDSIKQQLNQQKTKHIKETGKYRDTIMKLEKDLRSLQKGLDVAEKEKSQLKEDMDKKLELEYKSTDNRHKLNNSNDTPRSSSGLDMFSKRLTSKPSAKPSNNSFFNRKNSEVSKRNNPCCQSTNSLKSFSLINVNKNKLRKSSKGPMLESTNKLNDSILKGNPIYFLGNIIDNLNSTMHKTCTNKTKGVCTTNHKHYRCGAHHLHDKSVAKAGKSKQGLNASVIKTDLEEAQEKIQSMCQLMVDSATRLE